MSSTKSLMDTVDIADRTSRRRGREALRRMLRTGVISEGDLMNVAAPKPGYRKSVQYLTVLELIDMGLVKVVPDADTREDVA